MKNSLVKADILIAGGSLAGMATALRLKQLGSDPVVFDKGAFPRPKLCGEFLGPDAFPVLRELGLFERVRSEAFGPVEKANFYDLQGRELSVDIAWISKQDPYALAISRESLDHLLVLTAREQGIPVLEHRRVLPSVQREGQKFMLSLQDGQVAECLVLVDSTGRHGGLHLKGHPSPQERERRWVGIQCHLTSQLPNEDKDLRMFFFPGGYGGLQPISPTETNLCMLAPADAASGLKEGFQQLVAGTIGQNPVAAELLGAMTPTTEFQTTASLNLKLPPQDGLLRIGDAMLTVDPFTGSGMAMALQTGLMAGDVIAEGLKRGWAYEAMVSKFRQQYQKHFGAKCMALNLFRPMLHSNRLQSLTWPLVRAAAPKLAGWFR